MSESVRSFECYTLVFQFRARDPFAFPPFLTGNIFRGALGSFLLSANPSAYGELFGPATQDASLGTAPPRPFVLRCRNLEGQRYAAGEVFRLKLNLFLLNLELLQPLSAALIAMGEAGFGPTRSRATLLPHPLLQRHSVRLDGPFQPARDIRVCFRTPTELKKSGEVSAPGSFSVLFGQIYSRLSRLSTLYGLGELSLDKTGLRTQAASIVARSVDLRRVEVSRRTPRLGRTHSVGGFIGSVEYSGDLAQFLPMFEAASFTGVGRHTVWGNGEISTERLA